MNFIAVETVADEGAAEVAREALTACDIPVELRRHGSNQFGARMSIEVRVPIEHVKDAENILSRLGEEAAEAAVREAARAEDEEEERAPEPPSRAERAWVMFMFGTVGVMGLLWWVLR